MRLTRNTLKVGRRRVGNGMQNDPEYRVLEKQRRREFAQDNPDYREKRRLYMREYRKRKQAEAEEE